MKYLIILALVFGSLVANADCQESQSQEESSEVQRARVETPKQLEGAKIVVTTADGKQYEFSAEEYMVAKRVRTTKVTTIARHSSLVCKTNNPPKNQVIVGARRDYTGVNKKVGTSTATIEVEKDVVLDAAYMRNHAFDTKLNLGVGIDTNGTPKALIGIDF